jgi:hypothetical protein
MTLKELANRFLEAQQANWRNPTMTARGYRGWLGRFIADHPGLRVEDFTVEMLAAWKLSLRRRKYSPDSINHFLGAVKATLAGNVDDGVRLAHISRAPVRARHPVPISNPQPPAPSP